MYRLTNQTHPKRFAVQPRKANRVNLPPSRFCRGTGKLTPAHSITSLFAVRIGVAVPDGSLAPATPFESTFLSRSFQDQQASDAMRLNLCSRCPREKRVNPVQHFLRRPRRMHSAAQLAAIPHAMSEPARKLLHLPKRVGKLQIGRAHV